MNLNFYCCQKCGKIIAIVKNSFSHTFCCHEPMKQLIVQDENKLLDMNDSAETGNVHKNIVPIINIKGKTVSVTLGSKISNHKQISKSQKLDWILIQSGVLNRRSKTVSFPQLELQSNLSEEVDFAVMSGERVEASFSLG